jgi:ActR/RegA family two-component response regulator
MHPSLKKGLRMQSSDRPIRLLLVDDELGILLTLPEVLRRNGFLVTAVGTVNEALTEITSAQFDVLISDLNIGHPSDGLTVVSAMRRMQPACVTLILTGYPGFESALEALRAQIDDYLIKPASIPELLNLIQERLKTRKPRTAAATKRIAQLLRENAFDIVQRALREMLSDPVLAALPLTDEQRTDDIPSILRDLAAVLDSADPNQVAPIIVHAAQRGRKQQQLGYTASLLATHTRLLKRAIYDVIHRNLSSLNLSYFMYDLKRLSEDLDLQLEHSLQAFLDAEHATVLGRQQEEPTGLTRDRLD